MRPELMTILDRPVPHKGIVAAKCINAAQETLCLPRATCNLQIVDHGSTVRQRRPLFQMSMGQRKRMLA